MMDLAEGTTKTSGSFGDSGVKKPTKKQNELEGMKWFFLIFCFMMMTVFIVIFVILLLNKRPVSHGNVDYFPMLQDK